MPVTFATYTVGMLALAGFPLVFWGFWSKDEILQAQHSVSRAVLPRDGGGAADGFLHDAADVLRVCGIDAAAGE